MCRLRPRIYDEPSRRSLHLRLCLWVSLLVVVIVFLFSLLLGAFRARLPPTSRLPVHFHPPPSCRRGGSYRHQIQQTIRWCDLQAPLRDGHHGTDLTHEGNQRRYGDTLVGTLGLATDAQTTRQARSHIYCSCHSSKEEEEEEEEEEEIYLHIVREN